MKYEIMEQEHLSEIMALQTSWVAENITFGFAAATVEQLAEMLTPYCLVAKDNDQIIGFVMAEVRHGNEYCVFPRGVSYLEGLDLFVKKEYRSQGIGGELLRQCEELARENGIQFFLLSTATKDAETIRRFYTDNGYTIWTTQLFKKL